MDRLLEPGQDHLEADCIHYIRQLCNAVAHMHKHNYINLGVKVNTSPSNCY